MGFLAEFDKKLKLKKEPPRRILETPPYLEGFGLEYTGDDKGETGGDDMAVLSHFVGNPFTGGDIADDVAYAIINARVYVIRGNGNFFKFNPIDRVIDNANLPTPTYARALSYGPEFSRLYTIAASNLKTIAAWNPATDAQDWSVDYSATVGPTSTINQVLYIPDGGGRICAIVYPNNDIVFMVDPATQLVTGSVATTADPLGMGYCPTNGFIYVGLSSPTGNIDVIDPIGLSLVTTINPGLSASVGARASFNPSNGLMYCGQNINSGGGRLVVINPATNTVVATIPVANGSGNLQGSIYRSFDQRMYGLQFLDQIAVINSSSHVVDFTLDPEGSNSAIWRAVEAGGFIYFFRGNATFGTFCTFYKN